MTVWETWQIRPGEDVTPELIRERGRRWVEESPEAAAFRALMDGKGPDWKRARNKRKAARRRALARVASRTHARGRW